MVEPSGVGQEGREGKLSVYGVWKEVGVLQHVQYGQAEGRLVTCFTPAASCLLYDWSAAVKSSKYAVWMNIRQEPTHILGKDTRYLFSSHKNGSQSGKLCKFLNNAFPQTWQADCRAKALLFCWWMSLYRDVVPRWPFYLFIYPLKK